MALTLGNEYYKKILQVLALIEKTQSETIKTAAQWIAELFEKNRVLHIFGSGHGQGISNEIFYRAGSFVPVNAILDFNLSLYGGGSPWRGIALERLEGYAQIILSNYDLRQDEIIIVISNSGVNPLPVEIAQLAKKKGLKVIALTNLSQSKKTKSRHTSGLKLYQVADLTIDTCVEYGDSSVEIGNNLPKVGPQSTIACCMILQMTMSEVAGIMYSHGFTPLIFNSVNIPGGDDLFSDYRNSFGGKRYLNY